MLPHHDYDRQVPEPWILQDVNYDLCRSRFPNDKKAQVEEEFKWDSDDDNLLDNEDRVEGRYRGYIGILGFHPYKVIVFLNELLRRGLAYHLNSSKVQYLGNIYLTHYD